MATPQSDKVDFEEQNIQNISSGTDPQLSCIPDADSDNSEPTTLQAHEDDSLDDSDDSAVVDQPVPFADFRVQLNGELPNYSLHNKVALLCDISESIALGLLQYDADESAFDRADRHLRASQEALRAVKTEYKIYRDKVQASLDQDSAAKLEELLGAVNSKLETPMEDHHRPFGKELRELLVIQGKEKTARENVRLAAFERNRLLQQVRVGRDEEAKLPQVWGSFQRYALHHFANSGMRCEGLSTLHFDNSKNNS
ncbi:MAG: hypothetical protein Q9227_009571 [Pyrenula ochraceoflavens]